MLYNCLKFHND